MKTKNFKRKLVLNKKTVVNLNIGELNHVKGGCATEVQSCPQTATISMIIICETYNNCPPTKDYPLTNCTCALASCDLYGCGAIIER